MNDPYLADHFHPLQEASKAILQALRDDESSPQGDLYKRLVSGGQGRYHAAVNGGEGGIPTAASAKNGGANSESKEAAAPSNNLIHSHSIPLPLPIASAMQNVKMSSSMGLFTEANLVWIACDNMLYLWRHGSTLTKSRAYESDAAAGGGSSWGGVPSLPRTTGEDVCSFSVPSGQCVVGVGIVRPKKDVFKATVEWCIIISTPSEVILCALDNAPTPEDDIMLRLIPTRFILPTDNVPMISIQGTKEGRIFMGGNDGCLYEMNYESPGRQMYLHAPKDIEEAIDNYFDGDGELTLDAKKGSISPGIFSGGKRVLSALTFGSLDGDARDQYRRRKCRKVNHSSVSAGIASVVPGVVVRVTMNMFGSSREAAARKGGPIVSLVLDEERMCLYTLGANGIICTYDMLDMSKSKEKNSPPRLACVLDTVATAKLYLDSVSRGRMYPPVTTQSTALGTITFPGGISSAQAGVGGMEGAREILKIYEREDRLSNTSSSLKLPPRDKMNSAGILHPKSIHLVAGSESKSLTLVAVTGGGLRYYLSSLTSSYMSSAQASQGSFDYSLRGSESKLARTRPSKKMIFCHIRAPPPYVSTDGNNDGLKIEVAPSTTTMLRSGSGSGIPPGVHNNPISAGASKDNRKGDVVKSHYDKHIFVLALDIEKGKTSAKNLGNPLLITLPDSAARATETSNNTTSTAITVHSGNVAPTRSVSGGISEISILPMTGCGGNTPVLTGGTIFDISSESNMQSSIINLFANSETPSDLDLQIGLIPSFMPPKSSPRKVNVTQGAISTIAAPNIQGRGVISSALSTLSNYLRSGQGYGYQIPTVSGSSGGLRLSTLFRLSSRHGCDAVGFSRSSAEIVSQQEPRAVTPRSTAPKSARLPSWLLTPSAAPMNFQSSMHLNPPGSDSILVLNAGGLHFFTNSSLLNNLASVLLRASNIAKDEAVKNFFTSYGYAEGCTMCFALATASSSNSNLRRKAEQAVLTHTYTPSMTLIGTGNDNDPLSAYKFQPSSLYEGLVKFSSRLLRPFWYKVAVVVTESRPIQAKQSLYSKYYSAVPAKVELLLDDITLDEIRRPLLLIQELMKKTFYRVVNSVPGASKTPTDSMDIDDDLYAGGLITRALQNQSRATRRNIDANQPHDLTPDDLRKIAFHREDRNMHSIYRLSSRCIQMLNLMTCLKHAHSSRAFPDVQWGLLHGLTFCQLVTTFEGQQRIETLLNALFSQSENNLVSEMSMEGDALADRLSRQCYLYFSSASRLTYLGFKFARDALSRSPVSDVRKSLANKAASYLRAAARHWHDPSLVVGRLSPRNNSDNWQEIAKSAIESGNPLVLAADELMKLGNTQGVADVCLICAANFGGAKVPRDKTKEIGESHVERMFDWEKGLYQQPPAEKPGDSANTQTSSTQSVVISGIKTAPSDALKACHSILFYYISKLLGESGEVNQRLAEELLGVCASSSDVKFLRSLYDQLVITKNVDTLLRIDSSTLESWLKEKKDVNLLFKYYTFHGRNCLAGDVMQKMALDTTQKISLVQRIEYLTRSANAFSAAIHTPNQDEQVSVPDLKSRIIHINEQLDVATIQQHVLTTVEQSQNTNLGSEKMNALAFSLVNVSDIYNEYAAPLNLFDDCLMIMETCRQNDRANIETLWRSVLAEEILPCGTNSRVAFEYLNELKDGSMIRDDIVFGESADSTLQRFDDGSWIPCLKARVTSLGKNLYGKGADYTFPLDLLLETLENLRRLQSQASGSNDISHPWPAQTMLDVGVPYYAILSTYEGFRLHKISVSGGNDSTAQLQHFVWIHELLELWVSNALSNTDFSSSSGVADAATQLVRAINQDRLLSQIDSLKSTLEGMTEIDCNLVEQIHSQLTNVQDSMHRNFL